MSETNITSPAYRFKNAQLLSEELKTNVYYFFVGDHTDHTNSELQTITSGIDDTYVDPWENMIFGKKIANSDIKFVIPKKIYAVDTVYAMYDDANTDLETSDFYTIVNEGSFYHIWKCLDNNNGANSQSAPSFVSGSNTELYQLADGYRWKYMSSVDSAVVDRFVTSDFFPLVANSNVVDAAVSGAIDVIKIENQGAGYDNYLDGTFRAADLRLNGNTLLYNLSNSAVSVTNGFYTGCLLYVTGGTGLGQYVAINDYVANSTGNIIEIDEEFVVAPLNGTTYEIRPNIIITPVGPLPTDNCVARGLVNATNSNSVFRVEILNRGEGYVQALANVVANSILGVSNTAEIRVINGPYGGHGYWQYQELFCKDVEVSVSLSNTLNGLVPATNKYQQVGILSNPLFANVNFLLQTPTGLFTSGETIYEITTTLINSNVTTNTSNTLMKSNNANWILQVGEGEKLLLTNQDATENELVTVNSVINATSITLSAIPSIACTQCLVYKTNLLANAIISAVITSNSIFVDNCSSFFTTSSHIIGDQSGSRAFISSMIRNDVVKTFNTFIELDKYTVNVLSGTFTENEIVRQTNTSAILFSLESGTAYVSNFTGPTFDDALLMVGNTSGAVADIQNTFSRELVYGSGQVFYLENIDPVTRANSQNEQFQVILRS